MIDNNGLKVLIKHLVFSDKVVNQADFASKLGYERSTISGMTSGKKPISESFANKVCEIFGVNIDWLRTGEGEMLKPDDNLPMINYDNRGVPYYDVDFIGGFDLVVNDQSTNPNYYIDCRPYNDATCWVNVTGHSMEPGLCSGDMVALKQIASWSEFLLLGEIYAIVTDDFRTIKMITKSEREDCYRLVPLNKSPEYHEQDLPKRLIRNIFKVQGSIKRY